jgi:hypothetical protein
MSSIPLYCNEKNPIFARTPAQNKGEKEIPFVRRFILVVAGLFSNSSYPENRNTFCVCLIRDFGIKSEF